MPRPPIDLHAKVREVLQHTSTVPPEADCPIHHFEVSANVGLALIKYIDDHVDISQVYTNVYNRHLGHLRRMVLSEFLESFERFLKEIASVCVDCLAPLATDDRFGVFLPKRSDQIAVFVNSSSMGKALCESDTWCNNATINDRFRSLLRNTTGDLWEFLLPGANNAPPGERARAATVAILWQIRHNLAHNVGVITQSDAMKFRVLIGGMVQPDCRLNPTTEDLRYVKRFLTEAADSINQRISDRVGDLLETYHLADPTLFNAQDKANEVSKMFGRSVTIGSQVGTP